MHANGTEVLNFGASTVEMSMQIGERLSTLSLEDAEATTEQDAVMLCSLHLQRFGISVYRSRQSQDKNMITQLVLQLDPR